MSAHTHEDCPGDYPFTWRSVLTPSGIAATPEMIMKNIPDGKDDGWVLFHGYQAFSVSLTNAQEPSCTGPRPGHSSAPFTIKRQLSDCLFVAPCAAAITLGAQVHVIETEGKCRPDSTAPCQAGVCTAPLPGCHLPVAGTQA